MQYNFIPGNQFQSYMQAKFNADLNSTLKVISHVRGKEALVYGYISEIADLFQPVNYVLGNPSGLYSDYESFSRHFVKYWRNALDIPREDSDELKDIFDEGVSSQKICKNGDASSVLFENGKRLTATDCLNAIYEVFQAF